MAASRCCACFAIYILGFTVYLGVGSGLEEEQVPRQLPAAVHALLLTF